MASTNGSINSGYEPDMTRSDDGHHYMTTCTPSHITPPRSEIQSSGEHDNNMSISHTMSSRSADSSLHVVNIYFYHIIYDPGVPKHSA